MSDGIRALMAIANAKETRLDFRLSLFTGQVLIAGFVAPWWWFQEASIESAKATLQRHFAATQDDKERAQQVTAASSGLSAALSETKQTNHNPDDEVTLVDAWCCGAMAPASAGGLHFPVIRVPLPSISAWWIAEGTYVFGPKIPTEAATTTGWMVSIPFPS